MDRFDAIVVGLGGAGSSTVAHLASGGTKVLGLEQFPAGHALGSSHGKTRIYRTSYSEGPEYVPLVQRAQVLWNELQRSTDAPIIRRTGGLFLGSPTSPLIAGALRSAAYWSLKHERLSAADVRARYPQFRVRDPDVAVWDAEAGAVFPENCMAAYAAQASAAGAELHYGEPVVSWTASDGSVAVRTRLGDYRARSLVVTSGSWTPAMFPDLALPLRIERQLVAWFSASDPNTVRPDRMPVFLWDLGGDREKYGLPDFGDGVKIGSWGGTVIPRPEAADRTVHDAEERTAEEFVRDHFVGVEPHPNAWTSCLYTMAPDHHFLIGRHPRFDQVVIVSACSGHGYKFTSVLGEIVARLVHHEDPGFDLAPFDPMRFSRSAGAARSD